MTRRSRSIVAAAWIAACAPTIGCDKPRTSSESGEASEAADPVPVERDAVTPVRDKRDKVDDMRNARARLHTERVLRELDADKDGSLSLAEATAVRGDAPAVFADFAAVDLDHDGQLSTEEITRSMAGERRRGGAP